MRTYHAHDLIKIANLAKILDNDPYYSASENRDRVFFTGNSIPTITSPIEMLYEWEAHGLVPVDSDNVDVLKTRKYSIRNLQSFLTKHDFPLPGALFPDSDNNTPSVYFTPLAAKYFGTEHQIYFEQKRQKNDLLNKFFFNSETVHREDYYQFEATPISQPEESEQIRMDALKEVQSVWLELKHNKFTDELRIVQEWIDEYLPGKAYFAQWKRVKELSEVEDRIHEYESHTPTSITEINIRERAIAELQNRKTQLQNRDGFNKTTDAENKVSDMFVENNVTNNFMLSTIRNETATILLLPTLQMKQMFHVRILRQGKKRPLHPQRIQAKMTLPRIRMRLLQRPKTYPWSRPQRHPPPVRRQAQTYRRP